MRTYAVLAVAILLSGCTSNAEKLCHVDISKTLLNPETAEFNDFKSLTSDKVAADEVLSYEKRQLSRYIPEDGAS